MKGKAAVTGASGQLGRDVCAVLAREYEVTGLSRTRCDVANQSQVQSVLTNLKPDIVINCAAYTNVDGAEADSATAFRINGDAPGYLAETCKTIGARFVHISTDYVFDGELDRPYIETDPTNPVSVYGKSKLAGEQNALNAYDSALILRTSWVYGQFGANFVKAMLKLGTEWRNKKESSVDPAALQVVNDQIGSPTWTIDIAEQIRLLLDNDISGIVHAAAIGGISRYEFTKAIFAESGLAVTVLPCSTDAFPRPAKRPRNSVLENRRLTELGLNRMRPITVALKQFLQETRGSFVYA